MLNPARKTTQPTAFKDTESNKVLFFCRLVNYL